MGAEIKRAGQRIGGSTIKPSVAMVLCYDSRFAFQVQENNPLFSYPDQFQKFYGAFHHHQVPVDIVEPTADLSTYKLVIAPALHIVPEAVAENLEHFVRSGGILVLTPRSGVKDETNAVINRRLPGLLAELCGVEVDEYDSLPRDTSNTLEFTVPELTSSAPLSVKVWCDVLRSNGATVVARYTRDYYAGKPAITLNELGQPEGGRVVYIGTVGNVDLYQVLAGWLLDLADVQPLLTAPEGVEVTERWDRDRRLLFVLNHTDQEQQIILDGHYKNLLNGSEGLEGTTAIASLDVAVLLQDK